MFSATKKTLTRQVNQKNCASEPHPKIRSERGRNAKSPPPPETPRGRGGGDSSAKQGGMGMSSD